MAANPPTLQDQYPQIYAQWVQAGGITDNFRANLLALTGGPVPAAEDIAWLCTHTATAINQLQAALAKYGAQTGLSTQVVVVSQTKAS